MRSSLPRTHAPSVSLEHDHRLAIAEPRRSGRTHRNASGKEDASCFACSSCLRWPRPSLPWTSPFGWPRPAFVVEIDPRLGTWSLVDARSGVRWPTEGTASAGKAKGLEGGFDKAASGTRIVRLTGKDGHTVSFEIVDDGRSLQITYGGKELGEIRLLGDSSVMTDREAAAVIVPCREGLLIPADSGVAFQHVFGTSEYEGCHMNMLGLDQERQHAAGDLGRRQRLARGSQHADRRQASPPGAGDRAGAPADGPRGTADPAGQGRLEHAGRGLSPDRRAEGHGRHAPPEDRPRPPRGTPARRGQREALDLPGTADERGQHARGTAAGPLDLRRGRPGCRAPAQRPGNRPLPVHHRRMDRGGL